MKNRPKRLKEACHDTWVFWEERKLKRWKTSFITWRSYVWYFFIFESQVVFFILLACKIKPENWTQQGRGFTVFKFKSLFMRKKGRFIWFQRDFPVVTNNRVLIKVLGEGGCCDLRMSNVYGCLSELTFSPWLRPSPISYFHPLALGTES